MRRGFTLLEILVGLGVLAALSVPLFQMFSGQRQEVAWSNREARLQALATADLLEAEARLVRSNFQAPEGKTSRTIPVGEGADAVQVEEVVNIAAAGPVAGLYRVDIVLTWKDPRQGGSKNLQRTKLVVNREESPLTPVKAGGAP